MKPKFTHRCLIHKNTTGIGNRLKELGYYLLFSARYGLTRELATNENGFVAGPLFIDTDGFIDCGTNETLFLAIAALRDDSDKYQWFCDNYPDNLKSFFLCEYDDVDEHIHQRMNGWDCVYFHKATVEELINHFNE